MVAVQLGQFQEAPGAGHILLQDSGDGLHVAALPHPGFHGMLDAEAFVLEVRE